VPQLQNDPPEITGGTGRTNHPGVPLIALSTGNVTSDSTSGANPGASFEFPPAAVQGGKHIRGIWMMVEKSKP